MSTHGSWPQQRELELIGGYGIEPVERRRQAPKTCGIDRCESPLERQLAIAFASLQSFAWRDDRDHEWCVGRWEQLPLVLLAQPACGPFRPDFAIVRRGTSTRDPLLELIAEVDGFEFHSTREQLRQGCRRDRFLIRQGATVLHFSGGEVWRDAAGCAAEAMKIAVRISGATRHHI